VELLLKVEFGFIQMNKKKYHLYKSLTKVNVI